MKRPVVEVPSRMHQRRAAKPQESNGKHELRPFNTIKEVAAFLNVRLGTAREFKKQGLLKPTNMHTNADMYSEAEVLRLKERLEKPTADLFAAFKDYPVLRQYLEHKERIRQLENGERKSYWD